MVSPLVWASRDFENMFLMSFHFEIPNTFWLKLLSDPSPKEIWGDDHGLTAAEDAAWQEAQDAAWQEAEEVPNVKFVEVTHVLVMGPGAMGLKFDFETGVVKSVASGGQAESYGVGADPPDFLPPK